MYKAYKFRIYPTNEQQIALAKAFGCCRWFWNYSLNLCQETYLTTGKGLSRGAIQGLLPSLKKEYSWLTDAYSQCLQYVALNLSTAYKNFFEKRTGFPRFKSKYGKQSISYPSNVKLDGDHLKIPGKVGLIYCKQDRKFDGQIKTVTVSLNPDGKYYASVLVDDGRELAQLSTEGKAIGIDLGLTHFCITSNGSKFDNPRHTTKYARNLKKKQQSLARKQKSSKNRYKAKSKVSKVHSKIRRVREDFLHKLSRKIVNENQVIAVENLNVKGMVRNHNLAKAISDCGWGQFCTMLKYKSEWSGKTYIEVDRFFASSKTCSVCLNRVDSLSLDIRDWTCSQCNTHHDRDVNAAINIRNEALRILDLGTRSTANGGNVRQPGKTSVLLDAVPCEVGNPIPL
ncbi:MULTISPECIES: RNA-guided endonuclease TnpB family protein [unclassified Microcoleus]|uniref:RNA-guided endonuclease TnpB family protein n=1 Tax=unclassified Microcoleus TaxID=2642155 RepID=UPI002FD1EE40